MSDGTVEIGDAVVREEEDDKQNRQARKKRGDRQRVSSVIIEKATVGDCDGIFFRAGRERGAKRGTEERRCMFAAFFDTGDCVPGLKLMPSSLACHPPMRLICTIVVSC